jgi:tetratricopeptide (TPR) repeat protein
MSTGSQWLGTSERQLHDSEFLPLKNRSTIATHKHLEYARGYLALGLVNEATFELEKIGVGDRKSIEVRAVWVELHVAAKHWELVLKVAQPLCEVSPEIEGAWIAWASALRKLQRVKEAEDVLLKAEPLHGGKSAILHYDLARYACLQGFHEDAEKHLTRACEMDKRFELQSLSDPDLAGLFPF